MPVEEGLAAALAWAVSTRSGDIQKRYWQKLLGASLFPKGALVAPLSLGPAAAGVHAPDARRGRSEDMAVEQQGVNHIQP